MCLSQFAGKIGLCLGLGLLPIIAQGRSSYVTNGGEYPISGSIPGDQVHPHVSVNTNGGYLVWEDNFIDSRGFGIGAVALNSSFGKVGEAFRVNQVGKGDQERPQVALLKDGGAAFVWQGGRQGFQHIYIRFLNASNSWLGGDIMVNTLPAKFQVNPVIASLANGNVVVIWSSFNQVHDGSMQDVYGQVFSQSGARVGSEFQINQTTPFNQRVPAVAALSTGGFVVAWVSEMQRSGAVDNADPNFFYGANNQPSVDIYARMFNASGGPANDEFLVNTGSDTCSRPSVASAGDGGFVIAWSQLDSVALANGWDIFARGFSANASGGPVAKINGFTLGQQFNPRISAQSSDYLLVWTSLAQDGSSEGVYGRFLNADGSVAAGEFRVNTTVVNSQMQPAVASDNAGRFLATWTSFVGGLNSFDLFAQTYASTDFSSGGASAVYGTPVNDPFIHDDPLPPAGDGGSTGSGSGGGNGLAIDFTLPEVSNTILPNGLALAKGSYNGLCFDTNGIAPVTSGYFTALTTDSGTYSAKLILHGATYSFGGTFDSNGLATKSVTSKGGVPLSISLQLDLGGGDIIRGHITSASSAMEVFANRAVFKKGTNPCPKAGNYTVVIPGSADSVNQPGGASFGTVKVDVLGNAQFSGTLSDGTKVTQKAVLSKDLLWPLYVNLYGGSGVILSWVQFADQPASDLSGSLIWSKAKSSPATTKFYSGGFTNKVQLSGSVAATAPTGLQNVVFSGGGLTGSITNQVTIGAKGSISGPKVNKFKLTIAGSSGLFKGTIGNPVTGKTLTFQGALLQKSPTGAGFFLGTGQSGEVDITPAP
jgi:hypothetical protein